MGEELQTKQNWGLTSLDKAAASVARKVTAILIGSGPVAQSVEQRIENPCVGGSIPPQATKSHFFPSEKQILTPFSQRERGFLLSMQSVGVRQCPPPIGANSGVTRQNHVPPRIFTPRFELAGRKAKLLTQANGLQWTVGAIQTDVELFSAYPTTKGAPSANMTCYTYP